MLTSKDLSNARTDIAETMFETMYILEPSNAIGTAGDWVQTMGTVGTALGRLDPLTDRDKNPFYAEQEAGKALYQLTTTYDTNLKVTQVIEINSISVNVLQVHDEHSDRIVTRAVCAKVEN